MFFSVSGQMRTEAPPVCISNTAKRSLLSPKLPNYSKLSRLREKDKTRAAAIDKLDVSRGTHELVKLMTTAASAASAVHCARRENLVHIDTSKPSRSNLLSVVRCRLKL
jgi:hypothetical protein